MVTMRIHGKAARALGLVGGLGLLLGCPHQVVQTATERVAFPHQAPSAIPLSDIPSPQRPNYPSPVPYGFDTSAPATPASDDLDASQAADVLAKLSPPPLGNRPAAGQFTLIDLATPTTAPTSSPLIHYEGVDKLFQGPFAMPYPPVTMRVRVPAPASEDLFVVFLDAPNGTSPHNLLDGSGAFTATFHVEELHGNFAFFLQSNPTVNYSIDIWGGPKPSPSPTSKADGTASDATASGAARPTPTPTATPAATPTPKATATPDGEATF